MDILADYKSHFDAGFKDFVMKLDILSPKVVKEMIANLLLEDPVYLKWAMMNKVGFEYFLKLNQDNVLQVYRLLTEPDVIFLRALKGHAEEDKFVSSNLPSLMQKQYYDAREYAKITIALQEDARGKVMQAVFDLRENMNLDPFQWKLPTMEIMAGRSHKIEAGIYRQWYEDGILALEGPFQKNERTGVWKHFYPNESLLALGEYAEGSKINEWKFHYSNGNLKSVGHFKNNLKNGQWTEYEANGEMKLVSYLNGKIVT